uniref:Uncharacterized protein n=1 Tax=Glossina austeni TaxID=7395 RepID=A0A1A9VRN2_GLOAU
MDQKVRHHLLKNLANLAANGYHSPLALSAPQPQQANLLSSNALHLYAAAAAVSHSRVPAWRPFFRLCTAPGLLTCDSNSFLIYRQRILSASVAQTADAAVLTTCAPVGATQHHSGHLASNQLILAELNNKSLTSRPSAAITVATACQTQQKTDLQKSALPLCDGITSNLPAVPQTDGDESNDADVSRKSIKA